MTDSLTLPNGSSDQDFALLYRLQVRDLEDFALFMATPDGRITTWNRGVQNVFGYTEEEWLGQHVSIIFNEDDRAAGVVENEMQTAAEQGRCVDLRWHRRKDGTRVYMTGVLRGLRNEAGALIGYSKIFLDDTARKQLEDALTQSNQDLQQFAFTASHDLQEPLRTMLGFAELLSARYREQMNPEGARMLAFMVDAGKQMSTLIADLLDYSQVVHDQSGAISVHLDEDLETAASLLRSSIEETRAVITHDSLPNIELSRNQMVRLFQNFLQNAIKFRKPDEDPRIHVSAERQDKEWMIRVVDNGIGFAPEHAQAIFAPFKRLHSARDYPGSGIGLAACKQIVEGYGGRIGADSTPGNGATFWFTIPVTDADHDRFGPNKSLSSS